MTPSSPMVEPASGFAYSDIRGLQRISDDAEGIAAAAQQFESLFVGMVLKSMRDANAALAEGNPLSSSPEMTMHQEMLDQQWAIHIAENGGLGLAPIIESQLRGERTPGAAELLTSGDVPRQSMAPAERLAQAAPARSRGSADPASDPAVTVVSAQGAKRPAFEGRGAFVTRLLPEIEQALADTGAQGLDPHNVLAQSALETGWGQHVIHGPDGRSSHNLFGIKAGPDWQGDTVEVQTLEVVNGRPRLETASFRAYPDVATAIRDYVDFLRDNGRYSEVLRAGDPAAFAEAMQQSGYATDPAYGHKILSVLRSLPGVFEGTGAD